MTSIEIDIDCPQSSKRFSISLRISSNQPLTCKTDYSYKSAFNMGRVYPPETATSLKISPYIYFILKTNTIGRFCWIETAHAESGFCTNTCSRFYTGVVEMGACRWASPRRVMSKFEESPRSTGAVNPNKFSIG